MQETLCIMIGLVGDDEEVSRFTDTLFELDPLANVHGDATFLRCNTILFAVITMTKGYGLGGNFGQCSYCPKDVDVVIGFNLSGTDKIKYQKDCTGRNALFIAYDAERMDAQRCLTDIYIDLSADKELVFNVHVKSTLLWLAYRDQTSLFVSQDIPLDIISYIAQYLVATSFINEQHSFTFFKTKISNTPQPIEANPNEEPTRFVGTIS